MDCILVTGASGLLGRAIFSAFRDVGCNVHGICKTRTSPSIHSVDLFDYEKVATFINEMKPKVIIHSAAMRFPDKVEANPDEAYKLNVEVSALLAKLAKSLSSVFVLVSTDYVFDGVNPPFNIDDEPRPVNIYGSTKLQAEKLVLSCYSSSIVFRVPVLYGPVEFLKESAVTCLFEHLVSPSSSPISVSDHEIRYPAHVADIASMCYQLVARHIDDPSVRGICQWSGLNAMTKYQMIVRMAQIFNLPFDHIVADKDSRSAKRPWNCKMENVRLQGMGISEHREFDGAIRECLLPWFEKASKANN